MKRTIEDTIHSNEHRLFFNEGQKVEKHRSTWALPTGNTRSICRMSMLLPNSLVELPSVSNIVRQSSNVPLVAESWFPVVAKQCSLHLKLVQPSTSGHE